MKTDNLPRAARAYLLAWLVLFSVLDTAWILYEPVEETATVTSAPRGRRSHGLARARRLALRACRHLSREEQAELLAEARRLARTPANKVKLTGKSR